MSAAAPTSTAPAGEAAGLPADSSTSPPAPAGESCPLCGSPLQPDQEWCMRCGAAARTRLAASSNWKAPIVAVAVVAALSLAVIAAALVELAGKSGSSTAAVTSTIFRSAPAAAAPTTTTAPPRSVKPGPSTSTAQRPGARGGTASGTLSKEPVVVPPSGAAPISLEVKDLIAGTGPVAKSGEALTVNYVGVLFPGGQEFASSWQRHKRFTFTLGAAQLIRGLERGVPGMRVGGRRELIIPARLAYGGKGSPGAVPIPPNTPLVFVVDLREVSGRTGANVPFYGEASAPPGTTTPAAGPPLRAGR